MLYSRIPDENTLLLDSILKKVEAAEETLGSEISKKLRNIIENTGLEKLANVLTEEEVARNEQNKIKEILQNQFVEDDLYDLSDSKKSEHSKNSLKDGETLEDLEVLNNDEENPYTKHKPDEL